MTIELGPRLLALLAVTLMVAAYLAWHLDGQRVVFRNDIECGPLANNQSVYVCQER